MSYSQELNRFMHALPTYSLVLAKTKYFRFLQGLLVPYVFSCSSVCMNGTVQNGSVKEMKHVSILPEELDPSRVSQLEKPDELRPQPSMARAIASSPLLR